MLQYTQVPFDGIYLRVPIINGVPFNDWSANTIDDYPSYCGAGSGIGDLIIPETLLRLRISPACHIHDISWELAGPTEEELLEANRTFLTNILAIVEPRSNWFIEFPRQQLAMVYYSTVNSKKNDIFWDIKREQGLL